eukprot:TRINITY_DN10892_c0_g2_i1.p1 TRINITY_DN10892_c0_g2~~TRINITY_DN10892_c0_g2_i1.p1  ORF type:complete len:580 (+),score=69.60 TRINITY_DN10892_c0_g2_i1:234-1742(+)
MDREIQLRAAQLARSRILQRFIRLVRYVLPVVALAMASALRHHLTGGMDVQKLVLETPFFGLYAFVGIAGTFIHICPDRINLPLACALMCALHAVAAIITFQGLFDRVEQRARHTGVLTLRFATSAAALGHWSFNACLQLVWATCFVALFWMMPSEVSCGEMHAHYARTVTGEFVITLMCLLVGTTIQDAAYAEAKATVDGKALRQFDAVARSFLDILCDAVVYLDPHLRVRVPSPQLATLLLADVHSSGVDFLGKEICDLVVEDEKESLRETLEVRCAQATTPAEAAEPFTAAFRDSSGGRVNVQILHTLFYDLDDMPSLVLGIREITVDEQRFSDSDDYQTVVRVSRMRYEIQRCEPAGKIQGFLCTRKDDFRNWLVHPRIFERHVESFFRDACLDSRSFVNDESESRSGPRKEELMVSRKIGIYEMKKKEAKSSRKQHIAHRWTAQLTLESSPSLFEEDALNIHITTTRINDGPGTHDDIAAAMELSMASSESRSQLSL